MKKVNVNEIRLKVDLLERLLSREELLKEKIQGRLKVIRKRLYMVSGIKHVEGEE